MWLAGKELAKANSLILTVHLGHNMAENKLTIKLTGDQQKQIKDATGESITELKIDLGSTGQLTEADLEQVVGGKVVDKVSP